jgi:glutathione S-transferase
MDQTLTLVSHPLCPYVQRAAIALAEKGVPFDRIHVDLVNKPDWFLAISPLGRVPVLRVAAAGRDVAIFESAVILEYLEETQPAPLHPDDPLDRAHHRSWMEYGSTLLNGIARLYGAKTEADFHQAGQALRTGFERVEAVLSGRPDGPFFHGDRFTLVDAVYGPIYRYFDIFEDRAGFRLLDTLPRITVWRSALAGRASVRAAVDADYPDRLAAFLVARRSHISGMVA